MNQNKVKTEFIELLTPSYYKIHSFILSLVANKDDAEDILQATIAYMWEHFEDFEQGTKFLSWAFTIAKFQVLTYRKKKKRSIIYFSDEAIQLIESENEKLSSEMDSRFDTLQKCIKMLRERDAVILKKRFENNISVKSLADEYEVTSNVIYKRLANIKKVLLRCVHKHMANGEFT